MNSPELINIDLYSTEFEPFKYILKKGHWKAYVDIRSTLIIRIRAVKDKIICLQHRQKLALDNEES